MYGWNKANTKEKTLQPRCGTLIIFTVRTDNKLSLRGKGQSPRGMGQSPRAVPKRYGTVVIICPQEVRDSPQDDVWELVPIEIITRRLEEGSDNPHGKNNPCVRKLIRPQRVWDSPQEVRDSPKEVWDSVRTENIMWSPRGKGHFAYGQLDL